METELFETLFKPEEFENADFSFSCGREKTEPFENEESDYLDNHVISLPDYFSNTNPKWPMIVAFRNSSSVRVDGKHMYFQSETSVFKCSVNGA